MQAVESLKICTLIRSFCPKHIKFRWKNTEELCFLALKSDPKLKEKLTLGSKNGMRNLVNFHPATQKSKNLTSMGYFCPNSMGFELKKKFWKSLKNCTLMGSFYQKHLMFQLESFRGIMCHDTEGWCKI